MLYPVESYFSIKQNLNAFILCNFSTSRHCTSNAYSDDLTWSVKQVTLSGNQQPINVEITEAAMELGVEVCIPIS